ncbi:hypothetical protein A2188_00655 [Candidatus Woesebacteria bacterium RIFOXYA1_FULL_43_9]|uniref:Cyclodeaminase/cyclohydrolase domain-containing protein n=1 Tax=Candidatus Woesebacteria bacterium RIFOXYA1_FULL_43_9 TaxID=1802534 RepID=A0A1F8CMQ7_9BACT|nr:MAG: hypothetical protein A2188_00655 [Candidatus Woesebacteria bacterium RIFOXYA1_FULL_43_9]
MGIIGEQTVNQFLCDLASANPTPGGGSVAALTGAMAASLCAMVARLTKKDSEVMTLAEGADVHRSDLLNLADRDTEAFDKVMVAYRSKDDGQVQFSLKEATQVPLATYLLSKKVEVLAHELVKRGNKNAVSDAKSAVYLSQASQKSDLANVEINLKSITDQAFVDSIRLQIGG